MRQWIEDWTPYLPECWRAARAGYPLFALVMAVGLAIYFLPDGESVGEAIMDLAPDWG